MTILGAGEEKYKLFWQGRKDGYAGVGILVAARWIDKVMEVTRISERIMFVWILVGKSIVDFVSAYAPQTGQREEEKKSFGSSWFR